MDRVFTVQICFLSTRLRYSHHLPHSITLSGENPSEPIRRLAIDDDAEEETEEP